VVQIVENSVFELSMLYLQIGLHLKWYNIGCSPYFSINLFRIILVQGLNSAWSIPRGSSNPF